MKLNEKCEKCTKLKSKKCKGYYFALDIVSFYCKKYKENQGEK